LDYSKIRSYLRNSHPQTARFAAEREDGSKFLPEWITETAYRQPAMPVAAGRRCDDTDGVSTSYER
jgi:hypothetical protein